MSNKADRTALHQAIRELFGSRLESETEDQKGEGVSISIKWNHRQSRNPRNNKRNFSFHLFYLLMNFTDIAATYP
jgi:hypothetical protein